MPKRLLPTSVVAILAPILIACGGAPTDVPTWTPMPTQASEGVSTTSLPTTITETPAEQPTAGARPLSPAPGGPLASDSNDWFATSGVCVACHQSNVDEAGNDVSIGEYWRSTMMANSATDPYYLSGVSIEVDRYPSYAGAIEAKCSTCHMPMAHFSDVAQGQQGFIFGPDGYVDPQDTLHTLALDGGSCTVCHQIQSEGLGDFESFSGGVTFDLETPPGERAAFGPFTPQRQGINMMSRNSGFVPQRGDHVLQAELCATCHNLYTHYVTEEGAFSDEWFPEQTPYSEWLNSEHAAQSTCQDCHMPLAEGAVVLANRGPAIPRSPYAKHSFAGGNVYLLEMLKDFGGELGVQSGTEHFDATIARTLTQLRSETATLAVSEPTRAGSTLEFDVTVTTITGHKLPTSYPSRRVWLHVTVTDAGGQAVFESGDAGGDGAITGNDNDTDALAFEPHYDEIVSPEQVQIYEAIMHDVYGNVTTVLLSASSYVKDNRLLPEGFDKTAVPDDIAPRGNAVADDDFVGGSDTISYRIDTSDATGPFTVAAELLYQSISYRWAQNASAYDTEQARNFSAYYDSLPNLPALIAAHSTQSR